MESKRSYSECCICYKVTKVTYINPCCHFFCKYCILQWMTNSNSCPMCRAKINSLNLLINNNYVELKGKFIYYVRI
jgi:hypothetical protein